MPHKITVDKRKLEWYALEQKGVNMPSELATQGAVSTNIEQVLLAGDLSKLNPQERLNYYNAVCHSLGLNPLTQPFAYIYLNGKLTLYAKKDCTEQLRKIHGVSVTKVDPKQIGDLVVVVTDVADREGRTDSSTGAVSIIYPERYKDKTGNWRDHPKAGQKIVGEDLANAMMKAETKSKRRATLSLCGLGMLDETEVDTLRDQGVASEPQGNKWNQSPNHDPEFTVTETDTRRDDGVKVQGNIDTEPDIKPRSKRNAPKDEPIHPQGEVESAPVITDKQRKMLFAIQRSTGLSDEDVKAEMDRIGLHCHRDAIPKHRFQDVLDAIDGEFRYHQQK